MNKRIREIHYSVTPDEAKKIMEAFNMQCRSRTAVLEYSKEAENLVLSFDGNSIYNQLAADNVAELIHRLETDF